MKKIIAILFVAAALSVTGCGTNVSMYGKVTFEDGTPLDMGMVVVENQQVMARGEIQSDGSYVIGSVAKKDGLPPGQYTVYITGAAKQIGNKPNGDALRELLVEKKFTMPDQSKLSIDIKKATKYDITVTKPEKQILL